MPECKSMQQQCRDLFRDIRTELRTVNTKLDDLRSANGVAGRVVRLEEKAGMYGRRWGYLGGTLAAVVINILTYLLIYGELAKALAKIAGN